MLTVIHRALGFSLPTVAVVTSLHLEKQATSGEALDGVMSGLFFSALFLLGSRVCAFFGLGARSEPRPVRETLAGAAAGVVTWALLWGAWSVPQSAALRPAAFAIHCACMLAASVVTAFLAGGRLRQAA